MEELENKYIELLLCRCLNFDKSKSLFISYDKVNKAFVDKLIKRAYELGINDIGIDEDDVYYRHDKLINSTLSDIESDPYFNKSKWDIYAEKNASFLMLETEFPGVMDDVDSEKLAKAKYINRSTRELFRKKETTYQISWCIAALPNEVWAKKIFNEDNAYEKLYNMIFKICMIDDKDPIDNWNNYIMCSKDIVSKLNELEIRNLHYKNSLGTDLKISMPEKYKWQSISNIQNGNYIVNMPSYEVFSSPDYRKTEGIVYSSKPLIYGGKVVDDFYIKFKNGKVIDFGAKKGYEILKSIIESDKMSCYLGEVALVNNDSPISNTNLNFYTTLYDENASCHLALGDGFSEVIENGNNMSEKNLDLKGINQSKQHVDFMIGTSDLEIEAETNRGNVKIFKKGNFNI